MGLTSLHLWVKSMSDKLFSTVAVTTSFNDGEQPTAAKLNTITAQLKRSVTFLEKAIGDLSGDSWPYSSASQTKLSDAWGRDHSTGVALSGAEERSLDIASIGRLVGPASNLNPRQVDLGDSTLVEVIPVGVHEFSTRFPIDGTISGSNPLITDPSLTIYVTTGELTDTGQYAVTPGGKVFCFDATDGGSISYNTDPRSYGGGLNHQGATFNVIPDPNQLTSGGDGCSLSGEDSFGRRTVTLPVATAQQSNVAGDSISLDVIDPNYNHQLELPAVLSSLSAEDVIPGGFLYLKNFSTGEVYKDAVYYYVDTTSYLVGDVDLDEAVSLGHKFQTITVGSNITSAIDDLRQKHMHSHDRSFGEPYVDVTSIAGQYALAGEQGPYTQSEMPGNYFAQYLHRDGFSAQDDHLNDHNIMRGDLVLGINQNEADPGFRYDIDGTTVNLAFGHLTGFRFIKQTVFDDQYLYLKAANNIGDGAFSVEPVTIFQNGLQGYGNVPAAAYPDTSISSLNNSATVDVAYSSGLMAKHPGVDKWEYGSSLDSLAGDYSTDGEWRAPTFCVYYWAEKTVEFVAVATLGSLTLAVPIELDPNIEADEILSITAMVKGSSTDARWTTLFKEAWITIGNGMAGWDTSDDLPLYTATLSGQSGLALNRSNNKVYLSIGRDVLTSDAVVTYPLTAAIDYLLDVKITIISARNNGPSLE